MGDLHPIDIATVLNAAWVNRRTPVRSPKAFAPNDPHWKRVAKDRAKRKAAKKHKQQMRRQGK